LRYTLVDEGAGDRKSIVKVRLRGGSGATEGYLMTGGD